MDAHHWKECGIPVGHTTKSESALTQKTPECRFAIAPKMVERGVVLRKEPLMRRHADNDTAARSYHPS